MTANSIVDNDRPIRWRGNDGQIRWRGNDGQIRCEIQKPKLEGLYGFGLDGVDLGDGDGGDVEVLSASGRAGEAAEHGELSDVGKSVGNGALHEPFDGRLDGRGRCEVGIEGGEGGEETLLLLGPGEELRVVPGRVSLGHGERPVEEVAHVSEDLHGTAAGAVEVGEGIGGVFQGANGAIGQCGKGVAE